MEEANINNVNVDPKPEIIKKKFPTLLMLLVGLIVGVGLTALYFSYRSEIFEKLGLKESQDELNTQNQTLTENVNDNDNTETQVEEKAEIKADSNVEIQNSGIMKFTSDELGITFSYKKTYDEESTVLAKRVGTTVYVYPSDLNYDDGQYVEVMTKEESVSLNDEIKNKFLTNFLPENCLVKDVDTQLPSGYEALQILTPAATDMEDLDAKLKLCPNKYTTSNGISYFESSDVRTDKYVYLSIGQYAIGGDKSDNTWQDTLRFLPKE